MDNLLTKRGEGALGDCLGLSHLPVFSPLPPPPRSRCAKKIASHWLMCWCAKKSRLSFVRRATQCRSRLSFVRRQYRSRLSLVRRATQCRQLLGSYVRDHTSSPVSDSTCVQTAAVDSTVQSTRLGEPYSRSFHKDWNFPLEFTIG